MHPHGTQSTLQRKGEGVHFAALLPLHQFPQLVGPEGANPGGDDDVSVSEWECFVVCLAAGIEQTGDAADERAAWGAKTLLPTATIDHFDFFRGKLVDEVAKLGRQTQERRSSLVLLLLLRTTAISGRRCGLERVGAWNYMIARIRRFSFWRLRFFRVVRVLVIVNCMHAPVSWLLGVKGGCVVCKRQSRACLLSRSAERRARHTFTSLVLTRDER